MRAFLLLILLFVSTKLWAQGSQYPQKFFRNPLNIPILLAGNFGECRPGHFHSGIDIKTDGKENVAVFAAADGYISRLKMEPGGFGHALYITHANGYTTLYAHLNDFMPALQKLVHKTQYAQKEWTLDLHFDAQQYPVKKGQQIAWSGNTGGSSAPHLHFEIRDSKTEHPLNPQLFGFNIVDGLSPLPTEIAIYDADFSPYERSPLVVKLRKKGAYFEPEKDSIELETNKIKIGVAVNDYMNNSSNTLSIYTAEWYADNKPIGKITLDNIGYDVTRYLNACADYKLKAETGTWFNHLFLLPNNRLTSIYELYQANKGEIELPIGKSVAIKIVLKDVSGNKSELLFTVFCKVPIVDTFCQEKITANEKYNFENPNLKFTLPTTAVYDDVCFEVAKKYESKAFSSRWSIGKSSIPVHNYFDLSIRPQQMIPFSLTQKIVMRYHDGKKTSGKLAKLTDNWYSASVRAFGDYWLEVDTTAPSIQPLQKNASFVQKRIRFEVKDDMSSVKKFTGILNGQWLCFEQHGDEWFYTLDEYCPKGKATIHLSALDENGNERKMDYSFTR